ncbi:serine/threonine protein kinase [Coleofasciculus sp. FACHB-712]|uniref:serine/threonine-protein kinase n=1 Tax=Coleofasciculus sp. FACHB-712 TaxID=2692789 RepID=UPI00168A2142|nr:serine/threonine-protein kinase [Coleofasciculus sp. FACHB-712]MBD1942470.1 serine/threonine protein kinase [Coleofasciculus sp. FACHB-712]
MSYCLNSGCNKPQNPVETNFCTSCGTKLLLKDRYRAIAPIGEGGFGRTFLAEDADRLKAACVIKQFLPVPEIQGNSAAMRKATQLFEQEARQLLQLGEQHPQIPSLFAYFEQDKRLYLVQQYIEGQELGQNLERQEAFIEEQIRDLLNDLLPVLQFVHEHQVIHRDIKPTNIIKRKRDGKFVLIDFGISKKLTVGTGLTKTGTKAGTEGYAPIEQFRSGKAYPASDLYSLGVTCIHLLTTTKLDELYDPLEGCWLWKEHLREKGKNVSSQLSQVLDKLLKDYVKERYQSAAEVLKDLNAVSTPPPPKSQNWRCVHTLIGHSSWVRSIAISPNGQTLASGSNDKTIKLWQVDSGKLIHTLTGHSSWVRSIAISPDGQTLASGSGDSTIKLWQVDSGKLIRTFTGHSRWVHSVVFSPDGQTLASGSGDKTMKLWQVGSGKLIRDFTGHLDYIFSVAFSPDGQSLASCSQDYTIKLWQVGTGKLIQTLTGHLSRVYSVAFSPDGQTLASASGDKTIKIWHLETGKVIHSLTGYSNSVSSVAFSPDGQTLAGGSEDKTIKIWHSETGKLIYSLTGYSNSVCSVAFSPDGQALASGSEDKTIKIWQRD